MVRNLVNSWWLLGLILTVELWLLSYWQVAYLRSKTGVYVSQGAVQIFHYGGPAYSGMGGWYREGFAGWRTMWWPDVSSSSWGTWMISFPLWMPAALFGAGSVMGLCRLERHRRRRLQGRCEHCDYNLRGLTGRCPECGRAFVAETPRA